MPKELTQVHRALINLEDALHDLEFTRGEKLDWHAFIQLNECVRLARLLTPEEFFNVSSSE